MLSAATLLAISLATTPVNAGALSYTRIDINTSEGDQSDPHVDANLAAYTSLTTAGEEIRYFTFPAGPDLAVPNALPSGGNAMDFLSDVDQGRIAFTRMFPDNTFAVMIYDTRASTPVLTPVIQGPGRSPFGVALGANTVLYADRAADGVTGEMYRFDLSTSTSTRLTTDGDNDQNPAVSPDGAVLVWEKCPGSTVVGNCQVMQWTGSGPPVAIGAAPSSGPDTNGTLVVYEGTRSGSLTSTDIFVRPVAGGPEVALELAGIQRNPSIRGSIIAFESRPTAASTSDIFLYDLSSNRLFQVTSTPAVNENLNDVTVLSTGEVRVVWTAQDDPDGISGNIYGATFALPPADPGTGGGAGGGGAGGGTGGGSAGGSGGGAGGGAGGGTSGCLARTSTLQATRYFSPTRWDDADVSFSPAFGFALPASIPVTAGNSGNHYVRLTLYTTAGYQTMCRYRGGAASAHPQTPAQIAAGLAYHFDFCTGQGQSLRAGDRVEVSRLELRVDGGDSWQPRTEVTLSLSEVCAPSANQGCGRGHGHHDGDDDDHGEHDDGARHHGHHEGDRHADKAQRGETGTIAQGLGDEPAPAMGCSASGGGLAWPALLLVLAFLGFQRRSMPIRVAHEQERRRLRR